MALTMTLPTPLQPAVGGTMQSKPWDPKATMGQAGGGLPTPAGLDKLVEALQQAKTKALLNGQLPGTTPQSLGSGTGMSALGQTNALPTDAIPPQNPALNLGGQAPLAGMNA